MLYIGLMSGTSLDGVDAVIMDFCSSDNASPSLKGSLYKPYPDSLKKTLHKLSSDEFISPSLMMETDQLLGRFYSDCCLALLDQHELQPHQIHAIGSHGQTIRHKPAPDGFSLQIGDAHLIAELTGITTVSDFRRRDIAAGGQGAPLVPAFHHDVFHSASETRQILNLGGIANITVLSDKTFGFDTGPANTLMNDWVKQHWGRDFDSDGNYARSGKIHHDLLSEWLKLPYFGQHPPKSTGRELFNLHNLKQITPKIDQLKKENILASLTELTAVSVSDAVKVWGHTEGELFICGGGAENSYLIERLRHHLSELRIRKTSEIGIPEDMVEASAFAWLAFRTMNNMSGNLPEATGASGERILGCIHPAYQK